MSASRPHTSAQIPDGMASGSPQLRRTLFLSCPRSCSAAYCSPFSRIYAATVSLDGILLSFFSLSESRTASTSTRSTQNAQDDGCGRMLGCICCMSSRSMAGSPYACCALSSAAPVDTGAASFAFDNVKRCVRRAPHFVLLMRHGCGRRYNRCPKIAPLSERPAAAWFCGCRSFSVLPCIDQELDL